MFFLVNYSGNGFHLDVGAREATVGIGVDGV